MNVHPMKRSTLSLLALKYVACILLAGLLLGGAHTSYLKAFAFYVAFLFSFFNVAIQIDCTYVGYFFTVAKRTL